MRRLLTLLLTITITLTASAIPNLKNGARYQIACVQFQDGCVVDGASVGQPTPVHYERPATTADYSYWYFTDQGNGTYTIQNAATGQFIVYDGQRKDIDSDGELRRYIGVYDSAEGNTALWDVVYYADGIYAIRNVASPNHLWDVRTDSYCVGTYDRTASPNTNQRFIIIDEDGNQVTEKVPDIDPTEEGFNVSSWFDATTESNQGWVFENATWSDPGFGNYRNGSASVISPFLERWQESWGSLPDCSLYQTLYNLPEGSYTLAADIISVRQASNSWYTQEEEVGHGVTLFVNNQSVEAGTRDAKPQHYTLDFTLNGHETATLGLRIANTNANWVAFDNLALYYNGTREELIEGEKQKVREELSDYYADNQIDELMSQAGDDFDALEALRKSTANLPSIDPLAKALDGLLIDGRAPVYVKSLDLYLCSTSLQHFGTNFTAAVDYTPREGCGNLIINYREVTPGSQYLFQGVSANKNYTLSVKKADGTTVSKSLTFTSLPIVRLFGTFSNEYSEGNIAVTEPTKATPDLLNMKAKWRGGITNGSGKHKRNYHVKLKDANGEKLEQKFFGLRKDNSWILESCQVDMSRVRNRVLTDLWNDYSTPPYYIGQESKAMTGTRGKFVELVLNDEYRGIYCMTENIDRKQMKLMKIDEETGTVHGQLWKSKDWTYATMMGTSPDGGYQPKYYLTDPNENSEMWDKYEVKYPDFEDYGYQTDWTTLYEAVDFVCHSTDEEFRTHIAEYFDLPLVIDYYILQETILSTDNHGKNMFFGVYDKQTDKKITFSVWDMDATCGQRWSDDYYHWNGMRPEQDYANFISTYEHGDYNLFKRLRDTDADDFNMKVRKRYRDLRNGHLATASILERFRKYLDEFKTSGAAKREYNKWDGDSDIAGLSLDFDNEMEYLTDWFTRRMNYLDTQRFDIASLPTEIAGIQTKSPNPQAVYTLSGIQVGTLSEFGKLPAGIYIVGGRKVVKE